MQGESFSRRKSPAAGLAKRGSLVMCVPPFGAGTMQQSLHWLIATLRYVFDPAGAWFPYTIVFRTETGSDAPVLKKSNAKLWKA